MATKRQRRRREKGRRHDYEFVYVDDSGEEVEVEEPDEKPTPKQAKAEASKPQQQKKADPRGGRVVEPPTWNRVAKRALIFAPFIVLFLYVVKPKDSSVGAALWPAAVMIVLLIPFMYLVDSMAYKAHRKRADKRTDKRSGSKPKAK